MKEYQVWAEEVLQKVREKMEWVSEKNQDKIPYTTDANGNYDDRSEEKEWLADDGLNWWTNGFWGGIMWLLYQDTERSDMRILQGNRRGSWKNVLKPTMAFTMTWALCFFPPQWRITG